MAQPGFFPNTSWSTVLPPTEAGPETRLAALERLFSRYRRPILLEIQSRARCNETEAEELAHQFIQNCLRRDFLKNVDPQKGRFRAFVKVCIANFFKDILRQRATEPDTGSIDETNEHGKPIIEPPAQTAPPEELADLPWAREVLALALDQLEHDCVAARRGALFTALKPFLTDDPEGGYATVAARLGMNEGAVRTATHRMRHRLGELIEEEIKETVSTHEDWRDELRYFLELLGRNSSVT